MKGNVTFDQVNLVSRITGEGVGRSFEGRGGLVLIKSERIWRSGGGGERGQFVHVSYKYIVNLDDSNHQIHKILKRPETRSAQTPIRQPWKPAATQGIQSFLNAAAARYTIRFVYTNREQI